MGNPKACKTKTSLKLPQQIKGHRPLAKIMPLVILLATIRPSTSSSQFNINKPLDRQMFSSRNLYNIGQNFIIYGSRVIVQRKMEVMTQEEIIQERQRIQREYQKACQDADEDGKPHPDPQEFAKEHAIQRTGFAYQDPNDGCYFLENDFQFCTKSGKITKVMQPPRKDIKTTDYFFGDQSSNRCKLLSYHIMYNFLYKQRYTLFHQYQLRLPYYIYPKLIRVAIFENSEVLTPEEIESTESVKNTAKEALKGMANKLQSKIDQIKNAQSPENKAALEEGLRLGLKASSVGAKIGTEIGSQITGEDLSTKAEPKEDEEAAEKARQAAKQSSNLQNPDLAQNGLLTVYVSDLGEVGCLPQETLILSSEETASMYKIHAVNYNMVEPWSPELFTQKEIFIDSSEGQITTYRRKFVRPEFMKFTIQRGGITLKPADKDVVLTDVDLNPEKDK